MSQWTRLILLGGCIGGLTYIFGGCLLSAFYIHDAVIYVWWFGLMAVSLIVLAWLKWPRNDNA
jgi:hypothetical protein